MPLSFLTETDKIQELLDFVFPNIHKNFKDLNWLSERAVLCPTNAEADEINERVSELIPGQEKIYKSCEEVPFFFAIL